MAPCQQKPPLSNRARRKPAVVEHTASGAVRKRQKPKAAKWKQAILKKQQHAAPQAKDQPATKCSACQRRSRRQSARRGKALPNPSRDTLEAVAEEQGLRAALVGAVQQHLKQQYTAAQGSERQHMLHHEAARNNSSMRSAAMQGAAQDRTQQGELLSPSPSLQPNCVGSGGLQQQLEQHKEQLQEQQRRQQQQHQPLQAQHQQQGPRGQQQVQRYSRSGASRVASSTSAFGGRQVPADVASVLEGSSITVEGVKLTVRVST